ncbi:MAG: TIGR02391 family protein, partial [Agromyces sp.]
SWTVVTMDWDAILGETEGVYHPESSFVAAASPAEHGTTILVQELQRKSPVNARSLAESLSKLFNYGDATFEITVAGPRTDPILVSRDLRYSGIEAEAEWRIPHDLTYDDDAPPITGLIITAAKPLPQEMRGVTLYAKGRLANDPEYFGVPESSYAFSYITGHIDADYLDDLDDDVIATDRRSVSWEGEDAAHLRKYLASVLREIATRRRETRTRTKRARLKKELGVDVQDWVATIQDARRSRSVREVLEVLESPDTELSDADRDALVIGMSEIAPEYADLHWRTLHPRIQEAAESLYRTQHYHHAVVEAVKRYINDLRAVSGIVGKETDVINGSFGGNSPKIDIVAGPIAEQLASDTVKNMQRAQHVLSEGLWSGFRDPLMHEEVTLLLDSDVFTYQDCLDALSLVSHLRRRIDGAASWSPATDQGASSPAKPSADQSQQG